MSSPVERRSPLLRLLDAFLQEENIKWVLGLGVCLLLGSSLRLVTLHWDDYTPVWKYLILVGYTVTIFVLGEFGYHRMGLRKTGTVLMSLTVLLIPISFLALHWVQPTDQVAFDALHHTGTIALLGVNLVWSFIASWRIFNHFLRRPQPTFIACYLTLCLAGAIVPGLPASWSLIVALALWGIFTIGTVKVNRHVFWLAEERRLPRIFGFFPILLLGAQFASVFVLGIGGNITPPWMGLLATLISLPILLTADAVARVFEQRTGGLVRPIPWSISGPLALGTMLSVAGVILAITGWPASPAIVPTAVIAAIAMGTVAQRTQKRVFVWGMVCCIIIAYQTSPVFFKELVLQLRDQAAAAVRETRLPYAFYGLTYAPLIAAFTGIAVLLRRRQALFAGPFQTVASVLPCLLLLASFTHPSAVLPVSLVLYPLFAIQSVLFRSQRHLAAACTAFLAAAYGAPGFALRVVDFAVSSESALLIWIGASLMLLFPGCLCDRWTRAWRQPNEDASLTNRTVCQVFGLLSAIAAAGTWVAKFGPPVGTGDLGLTAGVAIALLLAVHTLWWLKAGLGELTLVFATYFAYLQLAPPGSALLPNLEVICWLLMGQWVASHILNRVRSTRTARAFGPATFHISSVGLFGLSGFFLLTWIAQHSGLPGFSWMISLAMVVWGLDTSRRVGRLEFSTIAWVALFIYVTPTLTVWLGSAASQWWVTAWTMTAVVLMCVRQAVVGSLVEQPIIPNNNASETDSASIRPAHVRSLTDKWLLPLGVLLPVLFMLVSFFTLPFLGWTHRFAAIIALSSMCLARKWRWPDSYAELALPLFNWHLLVIVAAALSGTSHHLFAPTQADVAHFALPVACLAAISLWLFETRRLQRWMADCDLLPIHQFALLALTGVLVNGMHWWHNATAWSPDEIALAAVAWLCLAGTALTRAVKTKNEDWACWALCVLPAMAVYFYQARVVTLLEPGIELVLLSAGIMLWTIGRLAVRSPSLSVLARPFQYTGFRLPLAVLPFAFLREFGPHPITWAGANSLPLLVASTFYFWRAMQNRRLDLAILSATLLNFACLFLWKDLAWDDPQLFLMPLGISVVLLTELMKREIPAAYHDRLRFVGSLIILVSPTFHIVTGSWWHILSLMVASTLLALLAIGLRVRTLLYTSTAFLLADLVALITRGSIDEPNVLWIAGVVLGAMILALGAACENHRETLLAKLRGLAAELEQWA